MIHHIFFPSMVETFGELASHIDQDLIEQCIKERGRLLDKFMIQLISPSEKENKKGF